MLHSYWSQHPRAHAQHQEKTPHWEAQALWRQIPRTAPKNEKENSQEKATLNLGGILNDMRHIYHERRNQGDIWPGEESSLLNHPHDAATAAPQLKDQCLIGSPATNSNLASLHGHTQSARRENLPAKSTLSKKVVFQKWKRNKNCPRQSKPDGVHHH